LTSQSANGIFVDVKPFMLLAVRVKCALSAHPAAWAAVVALAPSDRWRIAVPDPVLAKNLQVQPAAPAPAQDPALNKSLLGLGAQ
jgi:hypothetical protein